MSGIEGPKLCAFHYLRSNLILGSEKNRWKWKTLKWWSRQYALFLLFVIAKIWPLGAEVIFLPKNFILKYFQKLMLFQLLLDQDKFMGKV